MLLSFLTRRLILSDLSEKVALSSCPMQKRAGSFAASSTNAKNLNAKRVKRHGYIIRCRCNIGGTVISCLPHSERLRIIKRLHLSHHTKKILLLFIEKMTSNAFAKHYDVKRICNVTQLRPNTDYLYFTRLIYNLQQGNKPLIFIEIVEVLVDVSFIFFKPPGMDSFTFTNFYAF